MDIKKIIREEMDDFAWIRDLDPKEITFKKGDVIEVHNVGDKDAFISWLGDYATRYLNNEYGEFITGRIVDIEDKRIQIQEFNTDDYIQFPDYSDMEKLRLTGGDFTRRTYIGLNMYYEILNP